MTHTPTTQQAAVPLRTAHTPGRGRSDGRTNGSEMRSYADKSGHMWTKADMNTYTPREMAKRIGRTPRTLRRWAKLGLLVPARTPMGRPIYTDDHLQIALDLDAPEPAGKKAKP